MNHDEAVQKSIDVVAEAAVEGRLLLFVGTGFSRAVCEWKAKHGRKPLSKKRIPNWLDFLELLCRENNLDPNDFYCTSARSKIYDCPAIASAMAKRIEGGDTEITATNGAKTIRQSAADITKWLPRKTQCGHVGRILSGLHPVAIVTTNYDEVIEALLDKQCTSISRRDKVRMPIKDSIAVWHFHGKADDPQSIVLTREDYLEFFRPGNYAQTKLAQLLHEYFTLFIGYSLSDMNLLAALDWAQNVYQTTGGPSGACVLSQQSTYGNGNPTGMSFSRETGGDTPSKFQDATCRHCSPQSSPQHLIIEFRGTQKEVRLATKQSECPIAILQTNDVVGLMDDIQSSVIKRNKTRLGKPGPDNEDSRNERRKAIKNLAKKVLELDGEARRQRVKGLLDDDEETLLDVLDTIADHIGKRSRQDRPVSRSKDRHMKWLLEVFPTIPVERLSAVGRVRSIEMLERISSFILNEPRNPEMTNLLQSISMSDAQKQTILKMAEYMGCDAIQSIQPVLHCFSSDSH